MTVKEIFELRKQGKIEEAYDAIRPLYAVHKGRYTSLCMFWTAADIFKKRLRDGHIEEATKIFEALKRVLPYIKDNDPHPDGVSDFHDDGIPKLGIDKETNSSIDSAAGFMQTAARLLTQARKLEQLEQSKQEEKLRASETNSHIFTSTRNFQEESHSGIQGEVTSTTQDGNSFEQDNSCPKKAESSSEKNSSSFSALSEGHKEESPAKEELEPSEEDSLDSDNSWSKKDKSSNSPLKEANEDLSGHLSVSLDEGIIRPIEGLTAIQRVVLACVVGHPGYSAIKISESTGIPQSLIDHNLAILTDRNLIEHRDNGDTSGYYPL